MQQRNRHKHQNKQGKANHQVPQFFADLYID